MSDDQHKTIEAKAMHNAGPAAPPCSLRQACVKAGLDRNGQRCATCPLGALCQSELRWAVRTATRH